MAFGARTRSVGCRVKHDHPVRLAPVYLDGSGLIEAVEQFLEVLGTLIESYEADHVEIKGATGEDVLKSLMEEHGLTQSDLPEVGSQGVVSEILHGRRELNTRQIKALSRRFGVSPAVFL